MITSIYDISNEFAGDLAAKLIAGSNDSEGNQDAYQVVLKLLQDSYEVSLSHYETISDVDLPAVPDKSASRPHLPSGAIQSTDMQRCERLEQDAPRSGAFAAWLSYSPTDFETQTFDRTELQRWLEVRGIVSAYRFDCAKSDNAAPMPVVTPEPQAAPVVPVVTDNAVPAKPLQRTAAQDLAILSEINKQGYDPMALPINPPGKPGAKAAIRTALTNNSLFTGRSVFDKAWERLTARADIAIQG